MKSSSALKVVLELAVDDVPGCIFPSEFFTVLDALFNRGRDPA
ncbi:MULTISPECIES: hypothetical protein [Serratia]|jgi:hypothetical protein|nr:MULTISPECIES: hypothetical protein [Serratia]